jgi:hypothetical protein
MEPLPWYAYVLAGIAAWLSVVLTIALGVWLGSPKR